MAATTTTTKLIANIAIYENIDFETPLLELTKGRYDEADRWEFTGASNHWHEPTGRDKNGETVYTPTNIFTFREGRDGQTLYSLEDAVARIADKIWIEAECPGVEYIANFDFGEHIKFKFVKNDHNEYYHWNAEYYHYDDKYYHHN